jgi:hypothetical protein
MWQHNRSEEASDPVHWPAQTVLCHDWYFLTSPAPDSSRWRAQDLPEQWRYYAGALVLTIKCELLWGQERIEVGHWHIYRNNTKWFMRSILHVRALKSRYDTCNSSCRWLLFRVPKTLEPITVAVRSEAWTVFARSNAGIVDLNPTRSIGVCLCLFCVCVR